MNYRLICIAIVTSMLVKAAFAQEAQQPDEILRITTELVQTGVVVLDKQGRFVDGLKKEQFLLKVDGQPVTPALFEHVIAGTAREEKLERSAGSRGALPGVAVEADSSYRGRTIIFFIDDLHLSAKSLQHTRQGILEFVETEMTLEDQVAIVSPSGQVGFLQRFSDLKPVVRAAVNRLNHKPYTIRDHEQIPMTEYQAIRIDQGDQATASYFVTELLKANNYKVPGGIGPPSGGPANTSQRAARDAGMNAEAARRIVKGRAERLLRQSESVTSSTLTTLENLIRSVNKVPGRKVLFLISDGFFLNDRTSAFGHKVKRITDAALRAGLVIYSLDARGTVSMTDVTSNRADPQGQLSRSDIGELAASQDALNALAVDTGGKIFLNSSVRPAVSDALRETSNYYLLAWRPTTEDQKSPNFKRLEVSIAGRSDLTVRVPRGFFGSAPKIDDKGADISSAPAGNTSTANPQNVETALISALASPSARMGISTKLSVSFVDIPGLGLVMTAATQMGTDGLGYGEDGNQPATVDLAGVVLNDQGKQAGSFKARLNVSPTSLTAAATNSGVVYNHKVALKPGIYQVRVAARDDESGRVGSAAQWIEIPDLSSKKLTLATLLLGGQIVGSSHEASQGQKEQVQFSVDHRFARESQVTFFTIIYNAVSKPGSSAPRLESQIEILRNGRRIVASPIREVIIEPNTDLARIPYGASIALKTLAPGRYVLRLTIKDLNANETRVNEALFEIK